MIIYTENSCPEAALSPNLTERFSGTVFFDIETTGLSWRTSHLYLIGAAWQEQGVWKTGQWFLQNPAREQELLERFSGFLRGFSGIAHFNGQTFDLPYLKHKFSFYRMDDPLKRLESTDLFRLLRPFRDFLHLPSLKQKEVEKLAGFPRKDRLDGAELIRCYRTYLENGSPELKELLLLHNHDDVLGMLSIAPLLSLPALLEGRFAVDDCLLSEQSLTLRLLPDLPLPFSCSETGKFCSLRSSEDGLLLTVDGTRETMKHFFPDYKNYYYLPLEDSAVHRSVGIYVDAAHRQKASASTCYQKASGLFFPQPQVLFFPEFRRGYREEPSWFMAGENLPEDRELLKTYALSLMRTIFR
jgi:hypothetical protein